MGTIRQRSSPEKLAPDWNVLGSRVTSDPDQVVLPVNGNGNDEPPNVVRKSLMFSPGLEGLRGFALIIVMVIHTGLFIVTEWGSWLVPGGAIVMSLFFTMSGFLITALLLMEYDRRGGINIPRFLWKRGRRILPPILLMLAAHWLFVLFYNRPVGLEWRQDIWVVTLLLNNKYAIHGQDPFIGADIKVLWSVAVEGQFYVFWPFLFIALKKFARSTKRITVCLIALIALFTAIRTIEYHHWRIWSAVYYRTEARLDAFFIGALFAFLWYNDLLPMKVIRRFAWIAWAVFIPSLWILRLGDGFFYSWGMLVYNLLAAVIVVSCMDQEFTPTRLLATRFMRFAGRVSYTFYVVHFQIFFWVVLERGYLPPIQRVALAWGGALILGLLCYWIAERPFLSRPPVSVNEPTPLEAAAD